ncbi:DUF4855 domain-containing protein [Brevibacillus sp. HB1.2]|nr:DUF4855 domain-containing protein [Brevibacillus sp. HB1.2]NTU24503.1 DUF4855 domain-containing protein [Brevibacillus sp. HB1.2]
MSKGMRGIHLYTGEGYGTVTTKMLNKFAGTNIHDFVVHLGNMDRVFFDYRKGKSDRNAVIDQMIDDLADFLPEYKASDVDHKDLYISLPALSNDITTIKNIDDFYSDYRSFMRKVEDTCIEILGEKEWKHRIEGFYFRTETIFPIDQKISSSNPTSNKMVKLLNDLAYRVRNTHKKEFMWAPYYGFGTYAENITHNLGVIANRTDIFDIICIQPQYYFQGDPYQDNVDKVFDSANRQKVYDLDGDVVGGGRKTSATALIGVTMEGDDNYRKSRSDRFDYYVDTFSGIVKEAPMVFYAGSTHNLLNNNSLFDAINNFYEV